jgi:signal transduction histidine kinase
MDELVAVMAHSLLNSVSVIQGSASLLRDAWHRLDDAAKLDLLAGIIDRSAHVSTSLADLTRLAADANLTAVA